MTVIYHSIYNHILNWILTLYLIVVCAKQFMPTVILVISMYESTADDEAFAKTFDHDVGDIWPPAHWLN